MCGEPAAENVLRSLIKSTGDDLEVREKYSVFLEILLSQKLKL